MDIMAHTGKLALLFGALVIGGVAANNLMTNEDQHIIVVGTQPAKPRDVVVETLNGPPVPYNASNATIYSKVTFRGEKFPAEIVCLEAKTLTSVSLACPGMQSIKETVKELKP